MPDLTIESAWTCDTNVDWATSVIGSKGDAYTVRWGQLSFREANRQRCEYGWTCTCKGFGFRSTCFHVKTVEASGNRCGWNACLEPFVDCGHDTEGEPCCPACGEKVQAFQVGV